jgi:hypothetical protein
MQDNALTAVEQKLQTIDITKLVEYTRKIRDIGSLNKMMAPLYLRDFIIAYDLAGSMLAAAVRYDLDANTALETAKAIAYLDKAGDYLESKKIKESSAARERYVAIDADVIAASNTKAKSTALVVLLKNKLQDFRMAHDDVKKMTYGEPYQTNEEGF